MNTLFRRAATQWLPVISLLALSAPTLASTLNQNVSWIMAVPLRGVVALYSASAGVRVMWAIHGSKIHAVNDTGADICLIRYNC